MTPSASIRDAAMTAAIAIALIVFVYFSWSGAMVQRAEAGVEVLQDLVARDPLLCLAIFLAGCIVATSLCFPVGPLLGISAGLLFGFGWGLAVVLAGFTIGSIIAMLGSRHLLRRWAQARFGSRLDRFRRGFERNGAAYLLAVRFNPFIPYWLVNLAVGLTAMRLRAYVPLTMLGLLPALLIYVTTGSQLETIAAASGPSPWLIAALLALSLLLLVPIAAQWWAARSGRS